MRLGSCDKCGKPDFVGWMPCVGLWLCPKCAARILSVSEQEVRVAMIGSIFLPNKTTKKKGKA